MATNLDPTPRYRLEELRRLGTNLAAGLGVSPVRAAALSSHLLWFDAAGATSFGIATLPDWLDRLNRREIDPVAEGRATIERAGTALIDGTNGLPPLVLEKAAGIAAEKARDVGIGIVRIKNLGSTGPAAPVAANLAIGPFVAMIAGPGSALSVALPMTEGLPLVHDTRLEAIASSAPPEGLRDWLPVLSALAGQDGWVILALSITSFEPLTSFQERLLAAKVEVGTPPGRLSPSDWESNRREARELGVKVPAETLTALKSWADRLGLPWLRVVSG